MDADPDKEFVIDWKYFTIEAGSNDASYKALGVSDKMPTFSSSIPNCDVETAQVFSNSAAT